MSPSLSDLQECLGYTFNERSLLVEALTHPSFVAENEGVEADNQRLEFFGDAVIQLIMTRRIFTQCPDWKEGRMTKLRAIFTRQATLAAMARHLHLGEHLRMGRGERQNEGDQRPSNLCDAFEALCAAIYIDCGQQLGPVASIIDRLVEVVYPDAERILLADNPKGSLQELSQEHFNLKPSYQTIEVSGPDHERTFTVAVLIGEQQYGVGTGSKRQKAEEHAARHALERLQAELQDPA